MTQADPWTINNKTVLITGATSGIGRTTALELAKQGATIILAVRNERKARNTVADIKRQTNNDRIDYLIVDFASQNSIRQMAAQFLQNCNQLHVLINNHGTINILRQETEDGLEETFAVNHLGYFLLTNLLLDRIIASAPARIINVSSNSHREGRIDFDNLQLQQGYSWNNAYGNAKLANILFTIELARRLEGTNVTTNVLHPGWVATNIGADALPIPNILGRIGKWFINLTAMSPKKGAKTTIFLATSPELAEISGQYFINSKPVSPSPAAQDRTVARRLWQVSEELVGLA